MTAVKGNREYTVDETNMESYVKEGFDIFDNGKKIKSGKGKTVSQEEYDSLKEKYHKLETEYDSLKEKLEKPSSGKGKQNPSKE